MIDLKKIVGFEWDKRNIEKSHKKHGILPNEAEEVFLDEDMLILEDTEHSRQEKRFKAIGKIIEGKILFLVFTIRRDKVRIISARAANQKERRKYEQAI